MELNFYRLSQSKHPYAQSFEAFVRGLIELDLVTHQFNLDGIVVPWNDLVEFNQCSFPLWVNFEVSGFTKFNGETFASIDSDFDRQFKRLLKLHVKYPLSFDIEFIQNNLSLDDMSFLYQSGLIKWYQSPKELPKNWSISILCSDHICIFKLDSTDKYFEFCPGYAKFSDGCSLPDKEDILRILSVYLLHSNLHKLSIPIADKLSPELKQLFAELISTKYKSSEVFDEIFLELKSDYE